MTVILTATTGRGVFDRTGDAAKTQNNIDENYMDMLETRVNALVGDHSSATGVGGNEHESALNGRIFTLQETARDSMLALREYGQGITIQMVDDDEKLPARNLPNALRVLDRQMRENTEGLVHNTATFAVSAQTGNSGNGNVVVSLIDHRGNPLKFVRTETLKMTCSRDAQSGGGTAAGGEIFIVTGGQVRPFHDADWPGGSGASISMKSSAGAINNGRDLNENIQVNGDFEQDSTTNLPDQWEAVAGAVGAQILVATTSFVGTQCLRFAGDGATNIHLRQKYGNAADGTSVPLEPMTHYSMGFYIEHNGTQPAAGVLTVKITSSTGGQMSVTPNHGSAVQPLITVDCTSTTAVTSSYQFKSVDFVTPADITVNPELRIITTTPLAATSGVINIDEVVVQKMRTSYVNGPPLAIHRGSTASVQGDVMNVAVTNNNTATGSGRLIRALDRMLGVQESGETIATLATATVADTLLA